MPWVKKAAAPDYVNVLARMRLALSGSADDWLLPWLNLLDSSTNLDVNAFCAAGPPPHADFTVDDFLGGLVGGVLGAGVTVFGLREKVNMRAREILFATLCENQLSTGETCTSFGQFTAELGDGRGFVAGYGWAIPPGCHHIRTKTISWAGGTHDLHLVGYAAGVNIANPDPGVASYMAIGGFTDHTWTAAIDHIGAYSNSPGSVLEFYWCLPGSVEEHEPDPITQPDSAIAPDSGVYTTIADLGAELDAIENKLHWIVSFTSGALESQINPMVADDVIAVEADDEDIPLAADVIGFIVTVSNFPPDVDERFGEPRMLHKLGRVVMGNGTGWLPPVEISVAPMMLLKPDPTVTVCRVQVYSPATATVTTLKRAPAVG